VLGLTRSMLKEIQSKSTSECIVNKKLLMPMSDYEGEQMLVHWMIYSVRQLDRERTTIPLIPVK